MAATAKPATIVKHSLLIAGHRTSISLEDAFWDALKDAARTRDLSIAALVAEIDAAREATNLSSAIRVFLLQRALEGRLGASPASASPTSCNR